ncbi:MAG: hypothetical protein JXR96_02025 [Deltaproteobacteria bacterium]|nr:hypothetical protein [Deltaproteobacteria bacterium]
MPPVDPVLQQRTQRERISGQQQGCAPVRPQADRAAGRAQHLVRGQRAGPAQLHPEKQQVQHGAVRP